MAEQASHGDYRLFVAGAAQADLPAPPADNFSWTPTVLTPRWLARIWHRARIPLPVELFTGRVDLFHATDFALPPSLPNTRALLTVHDLSFVRVPKAASPPLKKYLDSIVPRSVARADHILADSAATKRDLIELYGSPESKISVLYSGVEKRFQPLRDPELLRTVRAKYGLSDVEYILSVGTVQPRKNYARVIEALAMLRANGQELHYVIAGGEGWLDAEIARAIEGAGMGEYAHRLGFVADEDLPALYTSARMLVMVSLYEGFGFPVLEAMACGTPVVASDVSSLPEVAGKAALLVDPYDSGAIAKALARLHNDSNLRQQLIADGLKQAASFTWQGAARQLLDIYADLLGA